MGFSEQTALPPRPPLRKRRAVRTAQAAAGTLLALTVMVALRPSGATPSYRPAGAPLPLPAEQLPPVGSKDFAGILVGLRGKPVIVNIWASWCPPCRAEMPLLERASRAYAGRAVFLGVASKDTRAAALHFLDEVGVTYPNVFDDSGSVRSDLDLRGFPTTYVFDAQGVLRQAVVGGITEQRLAAQLDDLLR